MDEDDVSLEGSGAEDGGLAVAISRLDRTQHIRGAARKGAEEAGAGGAASGALARVLAGKAPRLARALRFTKSALPRPLPARDAERLRRATGFQEVTVKLDRWDAAVTQARALEHKQFPLLDVEDRQKQAPDAYLSKYHITSKLEDDLNNLEPVTERPEESVFPLTMAEMIEHRKEAAKLRAKQSFKEAKARRQSKIKSKKFHRIQRKEKIRTQLKEFEILQKTNPEEALRKLEELEKTRAEERVTLRHKSTGQWAKNKLVRAKYNKETRQELAQQLAISRELTQKIGKIDGLDSDEESDTPDRPETKADSSNPWLRQGEETSAYPDFVSGYKKYWEEHNNIKSQSVEMEPPNVEEDNNDEVNMDDCIVSAKADEIHGSFKEEKIEKLKISRKQMKKNKKKTNVIATTPWKVEILSNECGNNQSIDGIFEGLENKLITKMETKMKSFKTEEKTSEKSKNIKKPSSASKKEKKDNLSKLSFKNNKKKIQIDEELNEVSKKLDQVDELEKKYSYTNLSLSEGKREIQKVDPNKFVAPKPRHLMSALPDMELADDYLDDEMIDIKAKNKMSIVEAFEDDDIVSKFQQEKEDDIQKNKPVIDDSFMPGWGSWTGKNLAAPKRKRRRMVFLPKNIPRKDDKKDYLLIKENMNAKLKSHMVSELPFPFTSVKDFEATIRAPLGRTFIPETAHKKLTKPAVSVKTGIVIKPMDESQLIDSKNAKHTSLKINQ